MPRRCRGAVSTRRCSRRVWRAAGFPDPAPDARVFTPSDIELFANLKLAIEFLGEDAIIQIVRVLGAAAARVADAAVSVFVANVGPTLLSEDPSGLALARANVEAMALLPGLVTGFDILFRHNMESARREIDPSDARRGIEVLTRSVGFVDMVGSTALSQQLSERELAAALTEFDAEASEVVTGRGGRVVKLIGDEVMFVAEAPETAVAIALALVELFAAHPVIPPVRGAVTTGEVLAREGDFSGVVVNLAAPGREDRTPVVGADRRGDPKGTARRCVRDQRRGHAPLEGLCRTRAPLPAQAPNRLSASSMNVSMRSVMRSVVMSVRPASW